MVRMDDDLIIDLYLKGESMRSIANKLETNHKLISRILKRNNVPTRKPEYLRSIKNLIVMWSVIITIWQHTCVLMSLLSG